MIDPHYPTIDIEFLTGFISKSDKIIENSLIEVGDTKCYILKGDKSLHKRIVLIRQFKNNQVSLEYSVTLAVKFNFLGELMSWLEINRNWKEGAYKVLEE